jgi:hypothetical protein
MSERRKSKEREIGRERQKSRKMERNRNELSKRTKNRMIAHYVLTLTVMCEPNADYSSVGTIAVSSTLMLDQDSRMLRQFKL